MTSKLVRYKWLKTLFGLLCALVLCPLALIAQQPASGGLTVSGTVTGSGDSLLQGVSVLIQGTKSGTLTDQAGHYQIQTKAGATLVFNTVGYDSKSVTVGTSQTINVQLQEQDKALNDVIVVSYGTQKARDITGSISQMNFSEVKDMPTPSIGQRMQGKFAGVQINNNDGTPGAEMSIRIRGAASINAGNNPLIVVDGFPSETGLSSISPDEIESVTVLKDASASSLYGSRAANGVILVTTKQAKDGVKNITFSANNGFQTVSKHGRPDVMNAQEFATFKKEYYEDAAKYEGYKGGVPEQYQHPEDIDPNSGTNWFDILLRNGHVQNYNVSIASGKKDLKSVTNLNYNKNEGVMINQWAERFTARSNNQYAVNDKINVGVNLGVIYKHRNITPGLASGRNIIQLAYLTDPAMKYKNDDGTYPIGFAPPGMFSTPNYYQVLRLTDNPVREFNFLGNAYATYDILDGLQFKTSINVNADYVIDREFQPSTILGGTEPASSASGHYNTNHYLSWLSENTLTYTKTFASKHNVEAFVGYTAQKVKMENSGIVGSQFPDDDIKWVNVAATRIGNVGASTFSLLSYIGRVNYDYDGRYLLSMAFRRDGSSKFGSLTKYGNFPSISAGWVISDEAFMKNSSKISFLKLRASYGEVGNNNIGDYTYLASVNQSNYVFNNQLSSGRAIDSIGNASLTWETTAGYDLGLDLRAFNDRITFTYDYYWKKTDGLLYAIDIPTQSGFPNITSNVGRFDFWGHEFSIESRNLIGKLTWTTNFNISFDRNLVKQLGTSNAPIGGYQEYWDDNRTAVGHPIGLFYGYINTGVYMTQEEFDTQPHDATATVGTARFKDVSGPDGKPDGVIDINDMTYIGNPNPDFSYGMTNSFSYGNFDLAIVLAGTVGNDIADDAYQSTENLDGVFNVRKGVANRWRSPEDPGDGIYPRTLSGTTADFRNFTTRQVFSGSYLMAKNITLGYTFHVSKKSVLKNARLYLSAQNAFTLTKYPGMNPEISTYGLNGLNQGRDFTGFPIAKTFSIGANITF